MWGFVIPALMNASRKVSPFLLDSERKCDYKRQTNENTIMRGQVLEKKEREKFQWSKMIPEGSSIQIES